MKIAGVHVALGTREPLREIVAAASEIDALGFGGIWIPESSSRDAFLVLAQIASATGRVELGTGIVNHYSRTPSALAQAAGTLSEASGGRPVNLGLGASSRAVIEGFHGVPFEQAAERMREALQIIRLALSGGSIDHSGEIFSTGGFKLSIEGSGPVRLYVAGLASGMLRVTGTDADGWLPIWPSLKSFDVLRRPVLTAAEGAGRPMPKVAAYIYTHLGADRDRSLRSLRRGLAWYMTSGGKAYNNLFRRYGFGDTVDAVEAAWRAGERDQARSLIPASVVEDMCILGEPTEATAQIASFAKLGIDTPVLRFPDEVGASEVVGMCRTIAVELAA